MQFNSIFREYILKHRKNEIYICVELYYIIKTTFPTKFSFFKKIIRMQKHNARVYENMSSDIEDETINSVNVDN